jgi:hypothetical protein
VVRRDLIHVQNEKLLKIAAKAEKKSAKKATKKSKNSNIKVDRSDVPLPSFPSLHLKDVELGPTCFSPLAEQLQTSRAKPQNYNERLFGLFVISLMEERYIARLFGWSLGSVFLAILALNALAR